MRLHFIATFASVKKMKKKIEILVYSLYLGDGWSDFLHIWYVDSPGWRETL